MSRPLRLEYPGAVWHVTSRGNERREIIRDDADRQAFLGIVGRTVGLFRWRLYAYVLMSNHYHLLLETPEPTLSRGMRQLNGLYSQAYNRRYRRIGHLMQGRFKSILVEKNSHLLELARYVVLNPVRAGMTKSARDWPWSSYRATAGLAPAPTWLDLDAILDLLSKRRHEAFVRYRRFVREGKGCGYQPWNQVRGQIYLGSDEFLGDVERRIKKTRISRGIPRRQARPKQPNPDELLERGVEALGCDSEELLSHTRRLAAERKALAFLLRHHTLLPLHAIGELLGVGEAQASLLVRGGERLLAVDRKLRKRLEGVFDASGSRL